MQLTRNIFLLEAWSFDGNRTRGPLHRDGPCDCSCICPILHAGESNQRPSAWWWALWVQLYLLVSSLRGIEWKTKCIGMGLVDVFDGVYLSDSSLMEIETFKSSENLLCIFNFFLIYFNSCPKGAHDACLAWFPFLWKRSSQSSICDEVFVLQVLPV